MSLQVNNIINVDILAGPSFPQGQGFGVLNIIGESDRLPLGERIRFYDRDSYADDFSSSDPEYQAAQIAFAQNPKLVTLAISRRWADGAKAEIIGSSSNTTKLLSTWTAITNGGFDIDIDGSNEQLTGLDFHLATSLNGVASVLNTALNVASSGASCVYDGSRFIIRSGTTGNTSSIGAAVAPTGSGSPTNIAGMLGMLSSHSPKISDGIAAESVTDALDAIQDVNQKWYAFVFVADDMGDSDHEEAAIWAEARIKLYGFRTNDPDVADGTVDDDLASVMKSESYSNTLVFYHSTELYPHVSAFARELTVDFDQINSTITTKFKQLPGIATDNIKQSQYLALKDKKVNYYTEFGDSPMMAEGTMINGRFLDEVHGLHWLQNAIETEVFGYILTRPTKIKQTDQDYATVLQQALKALKKGVDNGLIAPGKWEGEEFGELKYGDYLEVGYYGFAQSMSDQSQSDREARIGPPIRIAAKGGGAIHFANITVVFQR